MHLSNLITIFGTLLLLVMPAASKKVTNPSRIPKNAILLSKVSTLTLRSKKLTSARRVDPVPQLECVGPKDVCKLYQVDVMRCVNEGADYDAENIQWSCTASLPDEFKLGSTDVLCEGYESSDDPYVLKGSCGVEYRLLLTEKGEQKYGKQLGEDSEWNSPKIHTTVTSASAIFFIIFLMVLFIILKGIWSSWRQNPPRLGGPRPGSSGGGGGGYNDDNDPPPPYDGPPPYSQPRKSKPQTTSNTRTTASSSRSAPQRNQQQGWRPGFWTGTAAGAAAGYAAASRSQRREEPRQQETRQRPGGLFGGWTTTQQQQRQQPTSSSPPSSHSPTHSNTRYESTGFGETRRR